MDKQIYFYVINAEMDWKYSMEINGKAIWKYDICRIYSMLEFCNFLFKSELHEVSYFENSLLSVA